MELKELLQSQNFEFKKKFGQNFIIDQNVLNNIVSSSQIDSDTCVIEIGPGLGSLTEVMLKKAKKVMSFEIDNDLIPILSENFSLYDNFILINKDILSVNIDEYIEKYFAGEDKIALVANLPYYITTPIILKLLSETLKIKSYTMMMQDEVADRICSKPDVKDYNALSIAIQYRAKAKKVLNISRHIFVPKPNVDSAVIKLDLYDEPPYKANNEEFFFKFIRDAFYQRRKTLINNLKSTGYNKDQVIGVLNELNINLQIRSEALEVNDFVEISNRLYAVANK